MGWKDGILDGKRESPYHFGLSFLVVWSLNVGDDVVLTACDDDEVIRRGHSLLLVGVVIIEDWVGLSSLEDEIYQTHSDKNGIGTNPIDSGLSFLFGKIAGDEGENAVHGHGRIDHKHDGREEGEKSVNHGYYSPM